MNGIRYPNISNRSNEEQLLEIRSYLHQLVDQLNYALSAAETKAAEMAKVTVSSSGKAADGSAQSTFGDIKGLIIKSADIVDAYYEEINSRLEGLYVAQSDFGTYVQQTEVELNQSSQNIEARFSNIQSILSDIQTTIKTIDVNAYINAGHLYDDEETGTPVYGLEIGQRTELDGEVAFDKFARFVSDKLSFYDANDNEVAYISDKKLYITHAEITSTLRMGGFVDTVLSDGGIVTKWVGTGG